MQLLSPAHVVFVLWLLAAAAPVATVLINSAMVPLAGTNVRVEQASVLGECTARVSKVDGDRKGLVFQDCGLFGISEPRRIFARSCSVLHTDLQRHRPRVA